MKNKEKKKKSDDNYLPEDLLEQLLEESQLLDDHGEAIIGDRSSKVDFNKEN